MNAKTTVFLVYAAFALIVFPLAIGSQSHLYADGAHHFANLLESKRLDPIGHTPARTGHHVLVQGAMVGAMHCGMSNVRFLSWLYGFALFYYPWCGYLLASWLFLRAGLPRHAVLATLLYCLLACFTSFFIISECHLASALFVLTLAVLATRDLARRGAQAALFILWILSFSCYEFWVFYFPACLGILLVRSRRNSANPACIRALSALAFLYVVGAFFNFYSIDRTTAPQSRDAMFGSHFDLVWPVFCGVALFFAISILLAFSPSTAPPTGDSDSPLRMRWRFAAGKCAAWMQQAAARPAFQIVAGLAAAAVMAGIAFNKLATPATSYPLRTLHLILPLLFAAFAGAGASLQSPAPRRASSDADTDLGANAASNSASESMNLNASKGLIFCLIAVLCIACQARLLHVAGFAEFRQRIFEATQSHAGYVAIEDALPRSDDQRYEWFWTYPTLSLLFQTMEKTPVKSVLYNPALPSEPYGPRDAPHARAFLSAIGAPVEQGGLDR